MSLSKKGVAATLFTGLMLTLGLGGNAQGQEGNGWPAKMNALSGGIGSSSFATISPWASEMSQRTGINISAESTSGHSINLRMIQAGQADFGITTTDLAYEAWQGKERWTGQKAHTDVRAIYVLDPMALQAYVLVSNSTVRTLHDLSGKLINISRAGSSPDVWVRRIFQNFGIQPAKYVNLSPLDGNAIMADGMLDGAVLTGAMPHPAIAQMEATHRIRLLPWSREMCEEIQAKYPAMRILTVPPNTYKGQTEAVYSVGGYQMVVCHKDIPESLIYEITKHTFAAKEHLMNANAMFKFLQPENVLQATIPLHKGAALFYQEQGLSLPAAAMPVE